MSMSKRVCAPCIRILLMYVLQDDIQSRPARTWYQTETQKQAIREASRAEVEEISKPQRSIMEQVTQMAVRDDYRDEDAKKKDSHRMSRKKRRRMQAMEEIEAEGVYMMWVWMCGYVCMHVNWDVINISPEAKTNSAVKRAKTASREKVEMHKSKTMAEMGVKKGNKHEKVRRPVFAVGGLDQDMLDWNGGGGGGKTSKKAEKKDAREKKFTEFDPNKKLRKGGKIGNKSFKSKGKFKRR